MRSRRSLVAWGVCVPLTLGASAAAAGYRHQHAPDAPGENFGAIAYSPSTRSHGWAYDFASRREAERRALAQCGRHAHDCIAPVWFRNACGALAVGFEGYGSGWGESRKLAETYAVQSCSRYSGGCTVVRWVCTSR